VRTPFLRRTFATCVISHGGPSGISHALGAMGDHAPQSYLPAEVWAGRGLDTGGGNDPHGWLAAGGGGASCSGRWHGAPHTTQGPPMQQAGATSFQRGFRTSAPLHKKQRDYYEVRVCVGRRGMHTDPHTSPSHLRRGPAAYTAPFGILRRWRTDDGEVASP